MESFLDPALADGAGTQSDYTAHQQAWPATSSRAEDDNEAAHKLAVAQLAALEQSVAEHTAAAVSGAYELPSQHRATEALDSDGLLLNQPPTRKRKKNDDVRVESGSTEASEKQGAGSDAAHKSASLESKIPKKRGRPKGVKDKPRDLEEDKPRPKRGRPIGSKNKPRDPTALLDPNKKSVGRPRKYPPGTSKQERKRVRELEEEAEALAALAAGLGGGGPMPLPAGGVPNQFAMGANMSAQGSSGGSAGRAGEGRELQSGEDYRPAMGLHPLADDMHLEHLSGMGLPSASSAPYLHTLEAFHPSAPLILPQDSYCFDRGDQPEDIPTGFVSSKRGSAGASPGRCHERHNHSASR